jgi:two-component system sensor histidine kinase UhpB
MSKEIKSLSFLAIEDNPGDFVLLEHFLLESKLPIEKILHADTMASAFALVKDNNFDIALLDLTLPDSSGLESVVTLNRLLPHTPIIVLSGLSTIEIAVESISLGAQDYLMKGDFDEKLIAKTVQYSIERKRTTERLQESLDRYEFVNKATQDSIWEWNLQTNEIFRNDVMETSFGYSNDPIKHDFNWFIRKIHPSDRERVENGMLGAVENKLEKWQDEFRFQSSDGSYRIVYSRGFIKFNEQGIPILMIGATTDLTEKKELEKELIEQQLKQQKLLMELTMLAQEEEKNVLGRELHDNINQIMATVKMYLGMVKSGKVFEEDLLGKSYEYVNIAMDEIRKLSHSLVPPSLGEISLKDALEELLENANLFKKFKVHLVVDENYSEQLKDNNIELVLYRIVQEQLNNINKYAKATEVFITLIEEGGNLLLHISDNGVGFDTAQKSKGIGLKNMISRVKFYSGNINIISAPGKGCRLEVSVPLLQNEN